MKKTSLMMATALTASFLMQPVLASDRIVSEKATAKIEVAAYHEDVRDLFAVLSDAHMSLQMGNAREAEKLINEAFEELEEAGKQSPTVSAKSAVPLTKIVELKFGNALMPQVVYTPVKDGPLEVDDFADALKLKGIERGDVEDAKVKYVRLNISRDKLVHDLNEAREELATEDFDGAQAQIHDAQAGMITEFDIGQSDEVVARDHVALTRFMLKAAEYEGAREALQVAESALINLKDGEDAAGRNAPEVEQIKADMEELQDMISRRDPSLADQIDSKLEKWWKSLS
ncbi:hypothetical protein [Kordiimonas aestuarii]|uniref:hypothetical protein n=1 Tax=Kordiimonas aestuarii TaxID=1005925 RepID=UPI0021D30D88|nr:hypothetical protein [Kordiimonas aestuarii]